MGSTEEELANLRSENAILRQRVGDLECDHNNLCETVNYLKQDTERCLEIISNFQDRTIDYLHYLEDQLNKQSELRPILIIGKEEKKNESDIS